MRRGRDYAGAACRFGASWIPPRRWRTAFAGRSRHGVAAPRPTHYARLFARPASCLSLQRGTSRENMHMSDGANTPESAQTSGLRSARAEIVGELGRDELARLHEETPLLDAAAV